MPDQKGGAFYFHFRMQLRRLWQNYNLSDLGSKVFQCHTLCSGSNNGRDLPILDLLKRKEDLGSIENLHEGSTAGRDRTAEQGQSQRICVIFFSSISIVQWAKGSADFKVNCLSHYHIGTPVPCFLNVKPVIFWLEDVLA